MKAFKQWKPKITREQRGKSVVNVITNKRHELIRGRVVLSDAIAEGIDNWSDEDIANKKQYFEPMSAEESKAFAEAKQTGGKVNKRPGKKPGRKAAPKVAATDEETKE